jgi:hypothetical protein
MYQGTTFSRAERSAGKAWALALQKQFPQGLKPASLLSRCGTAEGVPDTKRFMR